MPKTLFSSLNVPPPPPGRSIHRALLAIAAGLLLIPIAHDATALGVSRWQAMSGVATVAETPILDTLGDGLEVISAECQRAYSWLIHDPPWRPTLTISLAIAWVAGAAWLLRRA